MKVEVVVLVSPSLIVRTVSVDVRQNGRTEPRSCVKVEVVVLAPTITKSPYGLCGRKTTLKRWRWNWVPIVQELCESRWPSWAVRHNEPSGFRGRKSYIEPCFGIGLSLSLICQLTSEDIKQHYLLGSHSRTDCLAAELFLNGRLSDTVFVTLLRTAVKTAISEVRKLLRGTGEVPM